MTAPSSSSQSLLVGETAIYECVTGHWCGQRAALTQEATCPLCGMPVTTETDPPAIADQPVFVRSNAVRPVDFDPNAITK